MMAMIGMGLVATPMAKVMLSPIASPMAPLVTLCVAIPRQQRGRPSPDKGAEAMS